MSKKNRKPQDPQVQAQEPGTEQVSTEGVQAAPEQQTPEQVKRSLQVAREANASNAPVSKDAPTRATLVRPAKGENPERRRVFGYDNGPGGKVPLDAKIVVVNAGSLKASYPLLAEAVEATPEADVKTLKSTGVSGKSFRRAFRSGLIRFSKD